MTIPLFKTHWTENDADAVDAVIRRGSQWAAGPEIESFEKALAAFTGRAYAVTCNSGTSALQLMLAAAGVQGKEVIVPSFTFVATANAVILAGGIPVFAESESDTLGLDAEDVERRITKKTRAVIALHYAGGTSCDIEKLQAIAKKHGLLLLEDNAHSLGVHKRGKQCGTFGEAAALSFCQNKLITTGEGGAVITDNKEWYERMKLLRSHGRVDDGRDYFSSIGEHAYVEVGYNFRMPTMNAALGISQLKNFSATMALRRKKAEALTESLRSCREITLPMPEKGAEHFYQMYTVMLKDRTIRDRVQQALMDKGIMSKVYYSPIHLTGYYRKAYGYQEGSLPRTEALAKRVLTLPMHADLTEEEIKAIAEAVKGCLG